MLSSVLKTTIAAEISIKIMRTFVYLRKYISLNLIEQRYINQQVMKNTKNIKILQDTFDKFKPNINEIFFNGQIYDAYSKIIDIMNIGQNEVILIDNYADKKVLDMISKVDKKVLLITRGNNLLKKIDMEKYNKQYQNLKIFYDNTFHDRYIILDRQQLYHLGSSLNHAGNKTFSINEVQDEFVINSLIDKIILTSVQNTHII